MDRCAVGAASSAGRNPARRFPHFSVTGPTCGPRSVRLGAFLGVSIAALLVTHTADAASNQDLEALVKAQAQIIAKLSARLAKVEQKQDALSASHTNLIARQERSERHSHDAELAQSATKAQQQTLAVRQRADHKQQLAIASRLQQDHNLIVANSVHLRRVLPDGVRPTPASEMTPAQVSQRIAAELARKEGSKANITAEWGQGAPILRSADGVWSFKPRGRILLDAGSTTGSKYGGRDVATTGARALRLGIEGGVGSHFFYQFETDFAGNGVQVLTAFGGYRGNLLPLTYDVRVGSLFNDRSFSGSTGSDAEPFLERNVVANQIIPQRGYYGVGIQGRLYGSNWHFSTALTGDPVDSDASMDDSRSAILRAHYNPIKTKNFTLHTGLWGYYESLAREASVMTRASTIGGRFNDNLRISTGTLPRAHADQGYGAELGAIIGPAWVMGEGGLRYADLIGAPTFRTRAYALSGGYFLFGAKPGYVSRTGNFNLPHVTRAVFSGGPGALEMTARYENLAFLNLRTGGGDGWAATIGGNWYLNDFVRIMLNGVQWHTNNKTGAFKGPDSGRTIGLRGQVSF